MPDFTILEFVEKLAAMTVEIEVETREALEESARIVEAEAKAEVGHYQDKAGPFAAWAELADSTKDDRVRRGYSENDPLLREGTLRDSIEHVVEGHIAHVGSNLDIAEFQELGTSRIPPRSFLGEAAFRKGHDVAEICGAHAVVALTGGGVHLGRLPIPLGAGHPGVEEGDHE